MRTDRSSLPTSGSSGVPNAAPQAQREWPREAILAPVPTATPAVPLTALITTFNEEKNIEACIRSVLWCNEILVVDSHSTDRTVEIAARFAKVRILKRAYLGAASQKNWAIDRASHDWILILDADERMTPDLRREIEELFEQDLSPNMAFSIPRQTYFLGRRMHFSGWQHDRVTRLFNRSSARYPNRRVHADMVTQRPARVLEHALTHYMVDDLSEYSNRLQRYARWGAAQLWTEGRSAGPFEVICRPLWRFLRTYFLQLGVVEGLPGLVLCIVHSWSVFLKWSILWGWQRNLKQGLTPNLPDFDTDPATWALPNEPSQEPVEPIDEPLSAGEQV